jgi:cytochrome c
VLLTLPPHGVSWQFLGNLVVAVSLAIAALVVLWRESNLEGPLSTRFLVVVVLLGGTVGLMALGRHLYRDEAIAPHREMVAAHTAAFEAESLGARMRLAAGTPRLGAAEAAVPPGERVFRSVCMACHDITTRRVGPPMLEVAKIYAGNPAGLIAWVKAPGKKRPDFPQMPPITMQDAQYQAVADYIINDIPKDAAAKTG